VVNKDPPLPFTLFNCDSHIQDLLYVVVCE
jgi:hypothetical protein